ncbi:MAG: threonine synthase [Pseudomonadota bacterium]
MQYISTRDGGAPVDFDDALLRALAPDGGLFMPASWPRIDAEEIAGFADQSFAGVAARVLAPFTAPCFDADTLGVLTKRAFSSFDHPAVAPLRRIGDEDWILELFHGPTLAFKDVAMQALGLMFEIALERRDRRATIIGATSGDTGAAAIEAFSGLDRVDIFILHPEGRVSGVQRRIMTSVDAPNVFNVAVEGDFDDCQRIVKALFRDHQFADDLSLGGVNSINWARLAVQIVYYFTAAASLGAPETSVSFSVPTGNFGDVFAGYAAKKMGLPIDRLCVAVNDNDILHRTLTTGDYAPRAVSMTTSPSMDIQVASNFERLVFEATGRDGAAAAAFAEKAAAGEAVAVPASALAEMRRDFTSEAATTEETERAIARHYKAHNILIDPHTAVGVVAAEKARSAGALRGPVVTLATAHPAKFPEAVRAASGVSPALPERLSDLYEREERCLSAPADVEAIAAILRAHARAGR